MKSLSTRTAGALRLIGTALLLGGIAHAARADCDANATQTDLNLCTGAKVEAADAELNALYKQIGARLKDDPATAKRMVAAQRAWIAFRDAECSFETAGVAGGSIEPMIHGECLIQLTEARSADFRRFLACEEGDLSCPVPPAD